MAEKQGTSPVFVDFDVPGIIGHGKCTGRERRARRTRSRDLWRLRRHRGELELDLVAQNSDGATAMAYRKQNARKRERAPRALLTNTRSLARLLGSDEAAELRVEARRRHNFVSSGGLLR
jgi:hypothetical protein